MSIQLTVKGEQDVYITGEPEVTYFKSVYRRFSPFYKQTYEIPFDGQGIVTPGFTSYCTLPAKGDVIRKIYLKTILPSISGYYQNPGTRIISEARLTVGGQVISTLTGSYIDLQNNMNIPYENQVGLTELLTSEVTSQATQSSSWNTNTAGFNASPQTYSKTVIWLPLYKRFISINSILGGGVTYSTNG